MRNEHSPEDIEEVFNFFGGFGAVGLPHGDPSSRKRHGSQEEPITINSWHPVTIGGKNEGEPSYMALPEFHSINGFVPFIEEEFSSAGVVGVRDGVIETNCGFYRLGTINFAYAQIHIDEGIDVPTAQDMLDWLAKEVQ